MSKLGYTPLNKEEYEARFAKNQRVSGYGAEVKIHMPCPFCACAEWMVFKILEQEEVSSKEHVCEECERGARMIYTYDGLGAISFEVVQTRGDDCPPYLPKIRRV